MFPRLFRLNCLPAMLRVMTIDSLPGTEMTAACDVAIGRAKDDL